MYILAVLVLVNLVLIGLQQYALNQYARDLGQLRSQVELYRQQAFPQFCGMCGHQRFDEQLKCQQCGHMFDEQPANEGP